MANESVSQFAARLQANMHDSELASGSAKSVNALLLRLFMDNLKSEFSKRLRIWGPSTFDAALESALTYEEESHASKREKIMSISEGNEFGQSNKGNEKNLLNQYAQQLNSVQQKVENLCSLMSKPLNSSTANKTGYQRGSGQIRARERNFSGFKCFHCKLQGHSFWSCPTANETDKAAISANLPTLIEAHRREKADNQSRLNNLSLNSIRELA